eukprot:TRINITY_DN2092_c0_g1_i1.p1 TRINITY_DN2092_c0_g1~~TRINITY_DN2092_c0_g1_i1.p1  ORF type:complete len:221 (-),score=43.51 TRINITY_DN2092_c0_g1_i1:21-683(-)
MRRAAGLVCTSVGRRRRTSVGGFGVRKNNNAFVKHIDVGVVFTFSMLRLFSTASVQAQETLPATFGAGCFWGTEKFFEEEFKDALSKLSVGYMGGDTVEPTYRDVCTGQTGHAEVLQVEYYPKKVDYKDLCRYFWRMHDPTTLNRQGNDSGTQYRSVIFYHNEDQKKDAEEVKEEIQKKYKNRHVVTEISPATKYYPAEDYHQKYLKNNPGGYCNHSLRW